MFAHRVASGSLLVPRVRWRSTTSLGDPDQRYRLRRTRVAPDTPQKLVAIRREDNSVWERRAPLSPTHVHQLVKAGVKVIIQPSNRRAFAMQVGRLRRVEMN